VKLVRDINEFLASIELNPNLGPVPVTATYQDSCHLAHGQRVRVQPRKLLARIPELKFRELPSSDLCCGSAGIYNIVHNDMAMSLLKKKMGLVGLDRRRSDTNRQSGLPAATARRRRDVRPRRARRARHRDAGRILPQLAQNRVNVKPGQYTQSPFSRPAKLVIECTVPFYEFMITA